MRKVLLGFVLVLVISGITYLHFRHAKPSLPVAYAGSHQVTLWNTTAQIREPAATVKFGDRLDVLNRLYDQVQVRTATGVTGWASVRDLVSAEVWQKAKDLETKAAILPVAARGHTRVLSNLHIEPGRDSPRIRQLDKDVPVELFERQAVEVPVAVPPAASSPGGEEADSGERGEARKEDWWFVRAHLLDQTSQVGWILRRFIDLDVPSPLPDYASSAGIHVAAWFELNHVTDSLGRAKPQYLVVGNRGTEVQACDFTLMRVFTWGIKRQRYETAFIESNVCGKLPVQLTRTAAPGADVTFSFENLSSRTPENRVYRMHQTIIRRVKQPGAASAARKHVI
jgi:hypothetical protein